MKLSLSVVLLLIIFCGAVYAQTEFSPLDGLATLRDFTAMRAPSTDPNLEGNGDARHIPPGGTLTLAELEGPGKIAHIWFTIAANERFYGKLLVLRMYWDGEKIPSVEVPLNDFFCQGHGLDVPVDSFPIRVTSNGKGRNCYWPMPFGKSAKITVTNEGKEPVNAFYYYIDWQKMKSLPRNTAYFHSSYCQEYPCKKGQDYLILDAKGRGHFVGCNLSIRQLEPGWWGEGDDRFYIDGEKLPSIQGTGSEDYFCDGWGIRKLDGLYYGFPITEGFETLSRHTNYRFHIQDPVPFTRSLRMTIEHKGARVYNDGKWDGYVERFDEFSSVAYWYQTEPHKEFPPLPVGQERLYTLNSTLIEGEALLGSAKAAVGKVIRQDLGGWSGGAHLFYIPDSPPASLSVEFDVSKAGKYLVTLQLTKSWDYGQFQTYLDGKPVGVVQDLYNTDVVQGAITKLGVHELNRGKHLLIFQINGKNPASQGYYFGLDFIELIPMSE